MVAQRNRPRRREIKAQRKMIKAKLIMMAVRFAMLCLGIGIGIWYMSSSLDGASLSYTSMDNFLIAAGVQNGDIANASGCFLCKYIADLFGVIGSATEMFWEKILEILWLLMGVGFGLYLFIYTIQYIFNAAKTTTTLDDAEKKLDLKGWFDKIWPQALRILVVGALMGMLTMGGTDVLYIVAKIVITPVLYLGSIFAMAATGVIDAAQCGAIDAGAGGLLSPVLGPFMCVIGNLNAVMLAGASGGFALMNYAWMGLGGGLFTWVSGLAVVIMFVVVGFDLFFRVLSIVFKLIFIIIFLPILLAAAAFEPVWRAASGLVKKSMDMLIKSSVQIIAVTLKVLIIYATLAYAADEYFPGPNDGYSSILPPLLGRTAQNPDARTMAIMDVFSECEKVSLTDGVVDPELFRPCFENRRSEIEVKYPGAFDFMGNGWDFLLLMMLLFFLYFYVVSPKVDKLLAVSDDNMFDFGGWIKNLGKKAWSIPEMVFGKVTSAMGKKG